MSSLFRFNLARLARVREIEERRARDRWLAADAVALNHEEVLARRGLDVVDGEASLRAEHTSAAIRPERVLAAERALELARNAKEQAATLANESRRHSDELRKAWQQRRADLLALERLEEKRRQEWKVERARTEARELDEISAALPRAERGMTPGSRALRTAQRVPSEQAHESVTPDGHGVQESIQ